MGLDAKSGRQNVLRSENCRPMEDALGWAGGTVGGAAGLPLWLWAQPFGSRKRSRPVFLGPQL